MKKLTTSLIILLIALTSYALASSFKPYSYPFIGRWQPAEDSRLIDEHGFQDIQNLRKDGKRLKGVSGHSKINTTQLTTTYLYAANAFHFRKDNPAESHVLVLAVSTGVDAEGVIWNNKTAIPAQGDFAGTLEHTDALGAGLGRFSMAPQGNMLYCNGEESLIWGGNEIKPYAFLTSVSTVTGVAFNSPKDYTDQIQNSRQDEDELATIGGGNDTYTKLLLHCDGTTTEFADATGVHAPVAQANAVTDTTQKKFGPKSGAFDGIGDYVSVPDHADWYMAIGKFTIDFWIRFNALPTDGNIHGFFEQRQGVNDTHRMYIANSGGVYTLYWLHRTTGAGLILTLSSTVSITINVWYHIALIRGWGGNANDWALSLNGSGIDTDTDATELADYGAAFDIGIGNATYINGWIDEFRVSKGIARWTSNFTPPVREYRAGSNHWVVGSPRPLQGAKFYLKNPNQVTGTITAEEWNGSSWTSLSITDNTTGLATSESITWSSTVDTSKPIYLQGQYLYWYQFHLSAGEADIYQVTADAPMQEITNIWDGSDRIPIQFQVYDGAVWEDYSLEVLEEALVDYETNPIAAEFDDLASTEYAYAGFHERMTGIKFNMVAGHENPNAATPSVYYWNGDTWETCSSVVDGTDIGGISLSKSGYIQWTSPNKDEEFTQVLFGQSVQKSQAVPGRWRMERGERVERGYSHALKYTPGIPGASKIIGAAFPDFPLYYYKFMWSAVLGTNVLVDTVVGIPAQESIKGYGFPAMFQGRSFLFSEDAEDKNKAIYSAFNAPDVWNGFDVGELYFGGDEKLTAAASLYNLYRTTGFHQLLITKQNETYRLFGDGPDNWQVQQMSENVGCIAPLSMAACELSEIEEGQRNVAIWQAEHGVVMSDGATIRTISDDIKCYWDRNDSKLIPIARLDDSVGWYDPTLRSYKLLITSGTGETAHNTELEYSLDYSEWTKIYREVTTTSEGPNPLQVGFMVKDTVGKAYSYGVTDLGYMYRLENGLTWDGTAISEYLWTKDLMLDDEWPLMRHTHIEYFRLLYEQKATTGESISIAHYCDGILTAGGTWDLPDAIDPGTNEYQTDQCLLGPCLYHSFKISGDFDVVYDGMELIGLGLYYEAYPQIRE